MRAEPERTCVGCRKAREKTELVRLVRTPEGKVLVDARGKLGGRGAYLCRDDACWQIAEKRRAADRALKVRLTTADWIQLRMGILS